MRWSHGAALGRSAASCIRTAANPDLGLSQESCDFKGDIIDPHVIAKQYGIPNATRPLLVEPLAAARGYGQGVAAFEDAEFKQADVDAFDKFYGLPPVSIKAPCACAKTVACLFLYGRAWSSLSMQT